MQFDSDQAAHAGPPCPPPVLPPWEERQRYGFVNAIYLTTREILTGPERFFSRLPTRGGLWQPLLFAIVIGVVSAFLDWMWALAASSLRILIEQDIARLLRGQVSSGLVFVMSPALAVVTVLIQAGIVHLCLLIVDGGRAGFEATFRVIAYAQAVWILAAVPFCGNVVALFWGAIVAIVGLRQVHRAETWRALIAVALPLLLCLASCGGLALLVFTKGLLE